MYALRAYFSHEAAKRYISKQNWWSRLDDLMLLLSKWILILGLKESAFNYFNLGTKVAKFSFAEAGAFHWLSVLIEIADRPEIFRRKHNVLQ